MISRDELRSGCAKLLQDLRKKHNMSKSKMAGLIYCDDHTWSNYESGKTDISVTDFIYVFHSLAEDALKNMLDLIYPSIYAKPLDSATHEEQRKMAVHYVQNVAPDRQISQLDYCIFGKSGSNFEPRMQEMCMIEHLPLEYRVFVAEQVYALYKMAESTGKLIGTDNIMPDVELMHDALERAKESVRNGNESYTTI